MKKSISTKLFIVFICFGLIIVSLSWLLNTIYLETYYFKQKKENLLKHGKEIQELYKNNETNIEDVFEKTKSEISGELFVFSMTEGMQDYGYQRGRNGIGKGMMPLTVQEMKQVIAGEQLWRHYQHPRLKAEFLVLALPLTTQNILILQTPIAAITESVKIATTFHIYIGVFSIIVGIILAFFFAKKFTKPIVELNNVAQSMAKLDFHRRYYGQNEDEIGALGKTINHLSDKLSITLSELHTANKKLKKEIEKERKIDQMRKIFISSVSHELKTPIALIQGYAEGLKDNVAEDKASKDFYCEVIIDETERMENLVKDLLDLAQMESGHFQLQKQLFDICKLIDSILSKYHPIFKENQIQTQVEKSHSIIQVKADPIRIEQVIVNFINNAIHHIGGKRKIIVYIKKQEEKVRISVVNTGSFISDDELDKIWYSFYKIDPARTRNDSGTGLGLSIVKAILELHHSSFGVFNTSQGPEFWFELETCT